MNVDAGKSTDGAGSDSYKELVGDQMYSLQFWLNSFDELLLCLSGTTIESVMRVHSQTITSLSGIDSIMDVIFLTAFLASSLKK